MAIFSNQATLTYNGNSTNSNIAYGEILEILAADKTAVQSAYTPGDLVTYVVSLRNSGTVALNGLTVSDDLGGYDFNGTTVYPLRLEADSVRLFVDGALQPTPTVTAGPPATITGISIPAGGDAVLVYQARVTEFAPGGAAGVIENTATVTGAGLTAPATATETVGAAQTPVLTISKSISPAQVTDNERVTYTFLIQNSGNAEAGAADNVAVTDTFDPILSALTVSLNGVALTEGVQYTYDAATGLFQTVPGQITVPAATYTQDPTTGEYTVTPGTATLVVTGTI